MAHSGVQVSLGQAALELAGNEFSVFAAHSGKDGACTCRDRLCTNVGKHPRFHKDDLAHGRDSATTDPRLIATWWARWPEANIGIATGDGLLVLDVDGPAGAETLASHPELPNTLRARTGRPEGGEHWYFEVPEGVVTRNRAKVAPGLDVRGDGGYVIAPPSVHASGARYAWVDASVEIALCPAWLLELVRTAEPAERPTSVPRIAGDISAYARAALEGELDRLLGAGEGTRNDTLNEVAFKLGTLVAGGELPEGMVRDEVWAVARGIGLGEQETRRTIESALGAAARSPREAPERPVERRGAPAVEAGFNPVSAFPLTDREPGALVTQSYPTHSPVSNGKHKPVTVAYPLEVWPGQVAEFIEQTACSVCVAPEAVGTAVLAVAAGAIGHARWLDVKDDWTERPGIYAGLVAASGERKSPALRAVAAPLEAIQSAHIAKWRHDVEDWDGKGRRPELGGPLMKDVTTEAVAAALMSHPRGVILLRDELVGLVRSFGQYKGGKGDDRQKWLEAWNGGTMLVRRRGSEPIAIEKPCLSVLGGIQPAVFDGLRAEDDGLAERFLYDVMPQVPLRASTPAVSRQVRGIWDGIVRELYRLPEREVVCEAEGCLTAARQRTLDARDDVPPSLRAYAGKGEAHLARLAIVLATVWDVCGPGSGRLTDEVVRRAEDLLAFHMSQAERLFCGDVITVKAFEAASPAKERELVAWLAARGGVGTKRDAMRSDGPLRYLSGKDADSVVLTLAARGLITVATEARGRVVLSVS